MKKKEEINQLKQMKKDEILDKLRKAEFIAGKEAQLAERVHKELETEFIPDVYDKNMKRAFGDNYYEADQEIVKCDAEIVEDSKKTAELMEEGGEDLETEIAKEYKQAAVKQATTMQ